MSLKKQIQHFVDSSQLSITQAYSAVVRGDTTRFSEIVASIKSHSVVQLVVTKVSSAWDAMRGFLRELRQFGPVGHMLAGVAMVAAGAMLWGSSSGLLSAVALALIVIGVLKALGSKWDWIAQLLPKFLAGSN